MIPSRQLEQSLNVARGSFEEKMSKFINICCSRFRRSKTRGNEQYCPYKIKKKISKIIFQCPISQKENSSWLERIRKYGDLGENFPSNSNGSSFGKRKSNEIELYQPQNALNFTFSIQRKVWHWLSTQMIQKIFFVSLKVGEREYQMEWFIEVECVLCLIFDICCAHCSALLPHCVLLN